MLIHVFLDKLGAALPALLDGGEDLLEIIMRRYERAATLLTSNRPVDDWGKLLGDTAAVTALLDRLLHHAHVLKCGPRSWRTTIQTDFALRGEVERAPVVVQDCVSRWSTNGDSVSACARPPACDTGWRR